VFLAVHLRPQNRKTPWGCSKSNRLMKDTTAFTKRSEQPEGV